jgi:hypothetical protein
MTNEEILKSTISTGTISDGILKPAQAKKFLMSVMEKSTLSSLVRHEMVSAQSGELPKLGIGRRLLRKKTEDTDDGYRANVKTSKIEYACTPVKLPWELTGEALRQNVEGSSFEEKVEYLMTTQMNSDEEDIWVNGDTSTPSTDEDYNFLKINDGWVKQINAGGHVFNANNADMSIDMFYDSIRLIPNKYNTGKLRWIMSPNRKQKWEQTLLNLAMNNGGAVPESLLNSPVSIPVIECGKLSDDKIMLADPKNLCVVNSYGVQIRSSDQGREAIMMDKKFYAIHFDFDAVIEELDATLLIKNIKAI